MLSILIIWVYIFLICFVFGWAAARFLAVLLREGDGERLPLSLIVILGLGFVATIVGYLSLFLKIAFAANAIILLGALLLICFYHGELLACLKSGVRRLAAMDKYVLGLLLLSSCFILLKSAAPTSAFDTGLYHAQAIRWIEEYPVIPGLGNLHGRLAFNSTWFLPYALFGFSFLKFGPFHVLNGFLLLIMAAFFLEGLSNLMKRQYYFSNILRAAVLLPAIFVYKDQLSSPTPDIPVTLLICAVFIYYLQLQENAPGVPRRLLALSIVLLATLAIIIKLTALPLALFMVVLLGRELARGRPVNFLIATGAGLFLVLPFFLRNIWLSGYLLYPFPGLDLFNFDWKIPASAVLAEKRAILEFARDPGALAAAAAVKGPFYWLPYWFSQLLVAYRTKLEKIFLPVLVICLDWLIHLAKMRTCKIDLQAMVQNKLIYLTAGGGLVFLFFTAPDLRLGMGFFMVFTVIIFMPFLKVYDYHVTRPFPWAISLLLLYFLAAFSVQDLPVVTKRLWWPAPYPQEALVVQEFQGKKVYFPQKDMTLCWYAPLPSAYYPAKFAFRGERIEDGFKPCNGPTGRN